MNEGAVEPWTKPKYRPLFTELKRYAKQAKIPLDVPWTELDPEQQKIIIDGEGKFPGVRGFFNHLERKKYKLHVRVFLSRYRGYSTCSDCNGARLRIEAQQVKINGKNICELCCMTVEQAAEFFQKLELTPQEAGIADRLLVEIRERLRFLNDVGLEYLTLDRLASTLSGGEAQRIQLATSLGSRLVGTLYVLDEPSIGLHSRDTHRLIKILHDLRDLGNTILVVEHDPDIMKLYVQFARARLVTLEQMRTDPKTKDRAHQTHQMLEDFVTLYNELNDNLDNFEARKSDLRKALKVIIEGDNEFQAKLRALQDDARSSKEENGEYRFVLSEAIESVDSNTEDHRKLLAEQEEFWKHYKKKGKS